MNNENTELSSLAREVTFHKHFSNGTAAIRGSTALTEDQHYWEIKMTTSVYGTDMVSIYKPFSPATKIVRNGKCINFKKTFFGGKSIQGTWDPKFPDQSNFIIFRPTHLKRGIGVIFWRSNNGPHSHVEWSFYKWLELVVVII